jgi:hypothetical protein
VQAYDQLLERYALATGFHDPQLDLTDYVTQGTLDGLFRTLAGEERRIRQDPVARSSELLETVFGATNSG